MSIYEKDDRTEEILDVLRILNTKIDMCMSDTDEIKESMIQLKFEIENMQEQLTQTLEEIMEEKNKKRWKKVNL